MIPSIIPFQKSFDSSYSFKNTILSSFSLVNTSTLLFPIIVSQISRFPFFTKTCPLYVNLYYPPLCPRLSQSFGFSGTLAVTILFCSVILFLTTPLFRTMIAIINKNNPPIIRPLVIINDMIFDFNK